MVLGNGLAVLLYDRILTRLLSDIPALTGESVLLCAGLQLTCLLIAGSGWIRGIAGQNLMQKGKGERHSWKKRKTAGLSGA